MRTRSSVQRIALVALWLLARPLAARSEPLRCDQQPVCLDETRSVLKWARNDPAAALRRFEELYAKFPDPRLLYNIGRMQHQLGQQPQAVESYRRYLASGIEIPPQQRAKTELYLQQALGQTHGPSEASQPSQAQAAAAKPALSAWAATSDRSAQTIPAQGSQSATNRRTAALKIARWPISGLAVVSIGLFAWRAAVNGAPSVCPLSEIGGPAAITVTEGCTQKTWPSMLATGIPALVLTAGAAVTWALSVKKNTRTQEGSKSELRADPQSSGAAALSFQ